MMKLQLLLIVFYYLILVYEDYNRVLKLKEIMFNINKDDEEYINVNDLLKIFNLKVIQLENDKFKNKTYFDALFK